MNTKIRVMIVDDHPFFRDGLAMWLDQQVGVTTCGDVVIMDLR